MNVAAIFHVTIANINQDIISTNIIYSVFVLSLGLVIHWYSSWQIMKEKCLFAALKFRKGSFFFLIPENFCILIFFIGSSSKGKRKMCCKVCTDLSQKFLLY